MLTRVWQYVKSLSLKRMKVYITKNSYNKNKTNREKDIIYIHINVIITKYLKLHLTAGTCNFLWRMEIIPLGVSSVGRNSMGAIPGPLIKSRVTLYSIYPISNFYSNILWYVLIHGLISIPNIFTFLLLL